MDNQNNLRDIVVERIRQRLEELKMSYEQLAKLTGFKSKSSINNIINEEGEPRISQLTKFADALDVSIAWLLGLEDKVDDGSNGYNLETLAKRLRENEFDAEVFPTIEKAVDYIAGRCLIKSVGLGDTIVRTQLGLADKLNESNIKELFLTDVRGYRESGKKAMNADIFILAANAISYQTGEMVNVSIRGSRIAGSLYYSDEVIFVVGRDVIVPNLADALHRAKYVYIPKACKENNLRTPCAETGKCYSECKCPDRACRTTCIYHNPPKPVHTTVALIDEDLGW